MKNKKFCIRPFNSVQISTNGEMNVCCGTNSSLTEFTGNSKFNLSEHSVDDFWKSDYASYLRKQFIDGNKPKECEYCWTQEQKGIKSLRQDANTEYKIVGNKNPQEYLDLLGKNDLENPEDYNVNISNLCNLKCYMCSGTESSKLLVENNALGYEKLNQKDYDYSENKMARLIDKIVSTNVTCITLQGGEPLLDPKIILLLKKLSQTPMAKKITIWITTNGTIYDQTILETLGKFFKIQMIFSIDGVGKVNDYLRFPSEFGTIHHNVKKYMELTNATIMLTCTVQNLNVLYITDIISFAHSLKLYCKLGILRKPSYLHLSVLPTNVKKKAVQRLERIDKKEARNISNFDTLLNLLKTSLLEDKTEEVEYFKQIISKRDNYRKIHMQNFIPELAQELNI
jgi:hypothetical protein